MIQENYIRKVQTSVTVFLKHGDEYLFLHRLPTKKVDANKLNGVGGRVEHGEDHLTAAVREVEEETGYKIAYEDFVLRTVFRIQEGYPEDWIGCFFVAEVASKEIPIDHETPDGKLVWIHKDKVLDSEYDLVDDLNYIWKDIISTEDLIFFSAIVGDDEKIKNINISRLKK